MRHTSRMRQADFIAQIIRDNVKLLLAESCKIDP
jgi:hypothetical protein